MLVVLVAASIVASLGMSQAGDKMTLRTLDQILRIDLALQRDVMLVRAGLLGNDDPLVADSSRLDASLERLLAILRQQGRLNVSTRALSAAVHDQDNLIERLKGERAVAGNSPAYLPLLGGQVTATDISVVKPLQALIDVMLRLDADNTPATAKELQIRIAAVAALVGSGDQALMLHYLLAHARLLKGVQPHVDALLHAIIEIDLPARLAVVRGEAETRRAGLQAEMRICGVVASIMFLLFLVMLATGIFLDLKCRRRERATAERIVTLVSMLFVACGQEQISSVLDLALAAIGQRTGFDRICIILVDPERLHVWDRRQEMPVPELKSLLLAAAAAAAEGETFEYVEPDRAPGDAAARLAAIGANRLAGFRLHDGERLIGIMTFEMAHHKAGWPASGVTIYQSMVPFIEKALKQERLAIEREAQQPRLRQAQRLVTAGELASGLAHNLNNIIGAVLGHAEMISACLSKATSPVEHIDEIRRAAERAAELVETMLNFSRRDLSRDEVAISELMSETLSLLRVTLPVRVSLSTRDEAAGALVVGRAVELQQVMLNLVRNASQSIEGAGRITLSLTTAEVVTPRHLPLGVVSPGTYVVLSVGDTGCGMDNHTLARIFEPFFTTRPAGSGLGLATVADIVRDHGGVIEVRSTPGAGSLFTAWLPQAIGMQTQVERGGQGEIVLFVEPVRERRLQIEEILAALSYEPAGFEKWDVAIDMFAKAPFDYDAWLIYSFETDQKVDVDAIKRIRQLHPKMPIVLIGITHRLERLRKTLPQQAIVIEPRSGTVGLAAGLSSLLHSHSK